jgi:hypothetical protein
MRPAGVNRFLPLLLPLRIFFFPIRHTPACAREHPFAARIFAVVDLCFVSTLRAQPRHFITLVLPTKHLFDPDGP